MHMEINFNVYENEGNGKIKSKWIDIIAFISTEKTMNTTVPL